jgi:hypothetical protein
MKMEFLIFFLLFAVRVEKGPICGISTAETAKSCRYLQSYQRVSVVFAFSTKRQKQKKKRNKNKANNQDRNQTKPSNKGARRKEEYELFSITFQSRSCR